MVFRQLGYDPEVLGFERVRNITKRIRHAACTPEGIQSAKKSRMRISKEHFSQAELEKMSRRGNCRDIAPQESFFGHMKDELAGAIKKWTSFEDVKRAIDDWIDYYSNDRYQWDLAKLSPNECYRYLTTGEYPF